jgi:thiamine-phosphate pyrophosphorylase
LQEASAQGIIDEKVVALGGVTFDSIPYLKHLGFGGVAMIGALYNAKALEYLTRSYKGSQLLIASYRCDAG